VQGRVLSPAGTYQISIVFGLEDDIKFVKRTKLWLPRPPGDAVLRYLGFTYKDDLKENRLEAAISNCKQRASFSSLNADLNALGSRARPA
jgi:hypothetical protein